MVIRRWLKLGQTTLLLSALTLSAQEPVTETEQRVREIVDSQFGTTKCPGLSVAVALQGEIVASLAYGMADLEQRVALTPTSAHRLASISKPVTATVLMGLVEQGKIDLDAPVRGYLPELPESYEGVTTRHLLSHQSGVRGYENPADVVLNTQHFATSRDSLKTFLSRPLDFPPGSKTQYSSLSFTVAGAAAEALTGRSFQQVAADFFEMHGISGFMIDDPLQIVPGRVRGYLVDPAKAMTFNDGHEATRDYLAGTRDAVTNARAHDVSNRYPAAGFTSSAEDLLRFVIRLRSGTILNPDSLRTLWTASEIADGTKSVFGLGWGVSERNGKTMVGMNGAGLGTTTFLRYFPDADFGVALLCNAEGTSGLGGLLGDIVALAPE